MGWCCFCADAPVLDGASHEDSSSSPTLPPLESSAPPRRLRHCVLLAEGAYSNVYVGRMDSIAGRVAVKVLTAVPAHPGREVAIMRRLRHEKIVSLVDAYCESGVDHIVSQFVEGEDIVDRLQAEGPFREEHALYVVGQLQRALLHMHHLGICHRDVKLDNLVLGPADQLTLIDMGFACEVAPGERLATLCGTHAYCSPEILRRHKYDGPLADCWSFGVCLFALLYATFPFHAADESDAQFVQARLIQRAGGSLYHYVSSRYSLRKHTAHTGALLDAVLQIDPKKRSPLSALTISACAVRNAARA